jgi:hypothetical protein
LNLSSGILKSKFAFKRNLGRYAVAGNPVKDLKMIRQNYARGWLPIDIASILPFDTLTALSGSTDGPLAKLKSVRIIRLLRLMKLLRVLRGMRIFSRLEARIEINYAMLSLQQFIVGLIMLAHWMACTFMMLHDMQWDVKAGAPCGFNAVYSRRESAGGGSTLAPCA